MKKSLFLITATIGLTIFLQGFAMTNIFKSNENVTINANDIVSNVICLNGNVFINGTVEENVLVLNGNVDLGKTSNVKGEVVVIGGMVNKSRSSKVNGTTTTLSQDQVTKITQTIQVYQPKSPKILNFISPILSLSYFFVILLVILVFPKVIGEISFTAETKPWKTLATGIISLILILPICAILLFSLIGITLLPFYFLALIVLFFFGDIAITQLIGKKTTKLFRKQGTTILIETIIGAIILFLLRMLPFFGAIISIAVCTFALGACVLSLPKLKSKF